MLNKKEFMLKNPGFHEGMEAFNMEGDKLGKVVNIQDDNVTIEKGFFFPKDFTFRYDDIVKLNDNSVTINQKREELESWKNEEYKGWHETERLNRSEETTIPIREEEMEARRISRPAGEVRIRKVVHTELRQFTVPVSKEDVVIERVPVTERSETKPGENAFKEEEIKIPLTEEDVEVVKRPVVKEEVHIRKETDTTEKKVSGEIRKEDVEVTREEEEEKKRKAA